MFIYIWKREEKRKKKKKVFIFGMEGSEHAEMPTRNRDLNKYYMCFCKAAAFASGLVISYKLTEKAIVDVFITFFTEFGIKSELSSAKASHIQIQENTSWEPSLRKAVAYVNFQRGLSALLGFVMFYISQAFGYRKRIMFCLILTYACGMVLFGLTGEHMLPPSQFYLVSIIGLILVAVGRAGLVPFLRGFTLEQLALHEPDQQNDQQNIKDKRVKNRETMWWLFSWGAGSLLAIPLFNSTWPVRFMISGLVMGIAILIFMLASRLYHKEKLPANSNAQKPFTCIRVVWAALLNRHIKYPSSPNQFFYISRFTYINHGDDGLELWPQAKLLRWIDKAAIIESTLGQEAQEKCGRLCIVTMVQETKYILKMVPMWSAFLVFGLVLSVGNTFFAEQASDLKSEDRFLIYLVLLQSIARAMVSSDMSPYLFRILQSIACAKVSSDMSPYLFRIKWFPKAKPKQNMMRIWGGMLISLLCGAIAWLVEVHRLHIFENEYEEGMDIIPMSIWWLAPQFFLLGLMDGLAKDGLEEFTRDDDHLSESMNKFLSAINEFVITGIGSILNILCVYPNTNLFGSSLNLSRLDLYYKHLTIYGTTLNCVYLFLVSIFIYRGSDTAQLNEASMSETTNRDASFLQPNNQESMSETTNPDASSLQPNNGESMSETTNPDASILQPNNEESITEE